MKRKIIITSVIAVLVIAAAVIICMNLFGASRTAIDNEPEAKSIGNSRTLVAYFSWSGHGQQMARWIADETGGDLFRIVPAESYGDDYNACADRAKNELDNEIRPELSEHIDADVMSQYDVIYVGFPIWWYDLPMPVWTFLEEYDLSGKTVIPFFSHHGSSDGANSVNRVSELAKGAKVLADDALSLRGNSVEDSEKEVRDWVKGFSKDN